MIFSSIISALFLFAIARAFSVGGNSPKRDSGPFFDESQKLWAQYSPFYSVKEYSPPPTGCSINQVNILQRHGARFPTSGAAARILDALAKFDNVTTFSDPKLAFLANYTYDLGTDDLIQFGAVQSAFAGSVAFHRYQSLISAVNLPFVRSSGSERVVLSATNWTAGFAHASNNTFSPFLSVIFPEDGTSNNTLDDDQCLNFDETIEDSMVDQWTDNYTPLIIANFTKSASGVGNLTSTDIYNLQSLCPFDTLAKERRSPFCTLFDEFEGAFEGFEYAGDLDKFWGTGYGNTLGRPQGIGYVNELLARLTSTPVQDYSQTNSTLDNALETFPLNRSVYADFSHDNQMIAIYAAMGLFRVGNDSMPSSGPTDAGRRWRASELVPFAGRMVVEKLACDGEKEERVRVLVNGAVQPLEFCSAGGPDGVSGMEGTCTLSAFVKSQAYAREEGRSDWEACLA